MQPRSCSTRRAPRVHALLGRRASQHGRHRERRHVGRDRLSRGRNDDDPCRGRRHHAAEPLAPPDRRAVRHARIALPGTHRPRARTRARHRPADRARDAPRSAGVGRVSAGRPGAPGAVRAREEGQRIQAVPGERARGAALDPRLEPVRRAARRPARPSLRVRLALRARRAGRRAAVYRGSSSHPSSSSGRTRWPA